MPNRTLVVDSGEILRRNSSRADPEQMVGQCISKAAQPPQGEPITNVATTCPAGVSEPRLSASQRLNSSPSAAEAEQGPNSIPFLP